MASDSHAEAQLVGCLQQLADNSRAALGCCTDALLICQALTASDSLFSICVFNPLNPLQIALLLFQKNKTSFLRLP
jgi:hypothetical protein